ncbi:major facilitator superfamily domain-containing protein [Panaeolus papilionaceus]|nr:major facilitator superfamily domain-containing protein [Panaeolus papilionaceus]
MSITHHAATSPSEESSLLPESNLSRRSHSAHRTMFSRVLSWQPHPFWLIPVVFVMSMSRGLTMSPRIQVYKAIACRSLSKTDVLTDLAAAALAGECSTDPDVQAKAARIQASVVTTMSVLSAISTGFWSRLGDTHGRKLILSTFLLGALLMEAVFVLVMRPDTIFGRHAERFILVGPIIEGFVGGLSTFNGVFHAYISDCTRHGSRSTIFSTVQGMVFVGLATGPWLGGLFFPPKGYNDGFFYGSIGLIFATMLYVIFICPESRKPERVPASRSRTDLVSKPSPVITIGKLFKNFATALLLPISMFTPRRSLDHPSKRNWNMTFIGFGLFLYLVSTGVYSAKYLYAQHVYDWTTAELGYYMSTLWITRAFNLLVFLPIVLSYLKPKSMRGAGTVPGPAEIAAELSFDRRLAQVSLAVDGFADSMVALTGNRSQPIFVLLSCLSSFTSGGNPALHSLGAICLHACGLSSDVGALFGAMGVLSAIAHVVSPYIYALTYGSSVAHFPEAIFVLAACLLFGAVLLLGGLSTDVKDIADQENRSMEESNRTSDYTYGTVATEDDDDIPSDPRL